jgi:hypothetical protein
LISVLIRDQAVREPEFGYLARDDPEKLVPVRNFDLEQVDIPAIQSRPVVPV